MVQTRTEQDSGSYLGLVSDSVLGSGTELGSNSGSGSGSVSGSGLDAAVCTRQDLVSDSGSNSGF